MGNVFFKLLNMSIAAGWLVLAVTVLRLVFKKAPRWVFCVLWAMVALRLALPFSVQSPFSVVPSVNTVSVVTEPVSAEPVPSPGEYSAPQTAIPAEVSSPQEYVSPSEHSAPESYVSRPAHTETVTPPAIPGTVDPAQTDNAHQQIQRIVIKTGIPAIDNTISASETERSYTGDEQTGDIGAVLFWIWASGAALMASYAAFSYLRLRLRLRCSIKGADGAYVCDTIDTPFILGLFRPRIYVPSGMNGHERSYVLAHEKAHLRRFDHLWKPLGYLLLAAYWFNPLMWLAYIFFCRDIEIACDEKVVKTLDTESKAGYSQTLLDLNRPRRMISACPLAFGEVSVKERIKKVLSYKKPTLWILIAALLLTTVLAVCLMTDPKEKGPDEEDSTEESSDESEDSSEESDSYENFEFSKLSDGTYAITAKQGPELPEELVIPSEHEGAAVTAVELSGLRDVKRIVLPQTVTRVISVKDCTSLTDIALPDSVAEIGESAFVGCVKLKSVKIPKNVARIGVSPFAWCPSLETIEVDEGNERYRAVSGCLIDDATGTVIGSAVYCTVPADEKVTRIGPAALAGVRTENVVIPSNIAEICDVAFMDGSMRTITLSEGVTTLGMDLCEKCFDLKELYIPVSVQAINENTFCLTIPDEDPELTIYYAGTKEQWAALTSEWPWDVERLDRCVVCSDGPVTDDGPIENVPALEVSDFVSADGGNIYYTCESFPGKTAVIKTENTFSGSATLKEFFVIDGEYTDPDLDYLYRVYRGRRYTRNKDGSFDSKRTYAVVTLRSGYYRCIEDEPEILDELVIVDYKDEQGLGEGEGKSVVAPFTGLDEFGEYGDQVLMREGSGFAVCFGVSMVPMPDWPLWRVYDCEGHVRTLPVEDSQRWSVAHVEFDKTNSDPDAVIVTFKNGNTFKANLRDTRVLADDEEAVYYYCYESSRSDSVPGIIYKGVIDPDSNLEGVKKVTVFPGESDSPVFTIKREYKEINVGYASAVGKMNMYVADYIVREGGVNRVIPDCIVVTYKDGNGGSASPQIIPLAGMLRSASDLHDIDVFGKVYTYYRSYIADNVHYNETHVFCVPEAERTLRHIECQFVQKSYDDQYLVLRLFDNGTRTGYMIVDRAGNIRSLPVPDDRIGDVAKVWSVNLDADGGLDGYDAGDMIVTFASGEEITAKLSDTRVLTGKAADEYYYVNGAQRDIYGYSLNGYGGYNLNMKVAVNDPVLELPSFHNGLPVNMAAITGANAKRIAVPETVIYLTLSECRELTSATLPASLKELGDFAFKDCPKLSTIYYAGTVEQWNAIIKGEDWDEGRGEYVIVCSDGYVAYEYRFENPTAAPVYLVQGRQTSVTQWETTESPGTLSYAQALEELANGNWIDQNGETPEPIEEPIYVFDCQMVCESGIPGFEGSVPFYRFTVETELDPGQVYAYVPAVKPN